MEGAKATLAPIEDEAHADERRAEVGLVPVSLCAYLSMMGAAPERCR